MKRINFQMFNDVFLEDRMVILGAKLSIALCQF